MKAQALPTRKVVDNEEALRRLLAAGSVVYDCTFEQARALDAFARRTAGVGITQKVVNFRGKRLGYTLTMKGGGK